MARTIDAAPAEQEVNLWGALRRRSSAAGRSGPAAVWRSLAERVDPAQYRPRAVAGVAEEQVAEGEQVFTVLRSPHGTYIRLTPAQRDLWRQMDGTRTVAQLATQAFLQSGQLLPVGDLVTALRHEGFLVDRPVGLFSALRARLEARTTEGWGRRLLRRLARATWRTSRVDVWYTWLYRSIGQILFTRWFLICWGGAALAGLVAFGLILTGAGGVTLFNAGGGLTHQLVTFWCALLVAFLLHESAHALAVKHFGGVLQSGGVMLYFGAPAFFVDTSDIWRAPRRARIAVSAAGSFADLLVGGVAALTALLIGDPLGASIAFKLALVCYVAVLFNLNPLLELDGYYVLVDLLRMPDLRRRALAFVRGPLWSKLRHREPLDHDERIFALYGILAVGALLVAFGFALQFWQRQLGGAILSLWSTGGLVQRLVAGALVLLVVVPIIAALLLAAVGVGRSMLSWVVRRGYGRQPALLAAVVVAGVALLTLVGWRLQGSWVAAWLPLPLWAAAFSMVLALRPDYRGAAIAPALDALLATTALAGLAALAPALQLDTPAWRVIWAVGDGVALLALLLAGLAALLDVNLRLAPLRELALTALLLVLACAAGGFATLVALPSMGLPGAIAAGAPASFGVMAAALWLPYFFALHDSRLAWAWALLWIGMLTATAAYIVGLVAPRAWLDLLAASLWAGSWSIHLALVRQLSFDELTWPHEASISEQQRLLRALRFCYAGCYRLLRAAYGARRARALDDRMDVVAATANWGVTLDRDQVRVGEWVLRLPLAAQGERYAEVLRYTVATIEDIAGEAFAMRTIQAAYDALPWPERETASRLAFPNTPWARVLSDAFGGLRARRLRLLRQVDLLLACDDDELAALAHVIEERRVAAGVALLREGDTAAGVWVIEAGEVLVTQDGAVLEELHRSAAFGASELLDQRAAERTYRTTVPALLLFIPASDFVRLARTGAPHAAEGREVVEVLRLLERVPLFADMPRNLLRGLAAVAERRRYVPRAVIVRQGQPSGTFFVIREGAAGVLVHDQRLGKLRPVARLGPQEFFGELELLRDAPPVATVIALTMLEVVALPHAAIRELVLGDGGAAWRLEQVGTGRLVSLRRGSDVPAELATHRAGETRAAHDRRV